MVEFTNGNGLGIHTTMKPQLTKEEEIELAIQDLHKAMLADMKAKEKEIEIAREKTKTHYNLIKAKQRLEMLNI